MAPAQSETYRERLREMRDRMSGEVDRVVESIREDLNPAGNSSNLPTHPADNAPENIDSDVQVIESERGMLDEIQAAIHRIDAGTFGVCEECGTQINQERVDAIPYAARCVECASTEVAGANKF